MNDQVKEIMTEALIRAFMAGGEFARAIDGATIHVNPIVCPYCNTQTETFEDAKVHDGECEKHPMARYKRALEWLESSGGLSIKKDDNFHFIQMGIARGDLLTAIEFEMNAEAADKQKVAK